MAGPEKDPAKAFFARKPGKWDADKFAARKPLSTIVDRPIRLVRAAVGSKHWRQGLLEVVDNETGEVIATVSTGGFRDPATTWTLRMDC